MALSEEQNKQWQGIIGELMNLEKECDIFSQECDWLHQSCEEFHQSCKKFKDEMIKIQMSIRNMISAAKSDQ